MLFAGRSDANKIQAPNRRFASSEPEEEEINMARIARINTVFFRPNLFGVSQGAIPSVSKLLRNLIDITRQFN